MSSKNPTTKSTATGTSGIQTSNTQTTNTQTTNIQSVLVANRGEIARRVFATARSMGMHCVAVYVDADASAPFVRDADEAVRLAEGSYLDGPAIIAAAQMTGAQAIHPGYGFLSENADFASEVQAAGLIWIGPSPDVITQMGDKILAKEAAVAAGVPVLSSFGQAQVAEASDYPILVKAAAGGGGKGMRVVDSPEDLPEAMAAARREALSGFGDDRVFLERYVTSSRHIEIQILGDAHGNLVHLGERECSIQRRHQKIIEESPSPVVDPAMRQAMGSAALVLAASIGYSSTGTVEFLVDEASKDFYFLEVNTRLQVEHPVTEAITGIDLVREQFRVASGEVLGYEQSDIGFNGHAIEARLYAEDPANGFLPAVGTLHAFAPASGDTGPALRWDLGIEQGSTVGVEFDPMLGKVISHGLTRAEAAGRLALGLEQLHLGGVTTNRDFLAATLRTQAFLDGDTTTDFVQRVAPGSGAKLSAHTKRFAAIAGALWIQGNNAATSKVLANVPSGWRNARLPMEQTKLVLQGRDNSPDDGNTIEVHYRRQRLGADGLETFAIGDADSCVGGVARIHRWGPDAIDVEIDRYRRTARVSRATTTDRERVSDRLFVQTSSTTLTFALVPRFEVPGAGDAPQGGLTAPMPGSVLDVRVEVGDSVQAGQTVMVLEAMKMEHPITAPSDGVINEVRVSVGQQVELGFVLMTMADSQSNDSKSGDRHSSDGQSSDGPAPRETS